MDNLKPNIHLGSSMQDKWRQGRLEIKIFWIMSKLQTRSALNTAQLHTLATMSHVTIANKITR